MADALPIRRLLPIKRRPLPKPLRKVFRRLSHLATRHTANLCALALFLLFVLSQFRRTDPSFTARFSTHTPHAPADALESNCTLFIAIGSAPGNGALRQAARDGWLRWVPEDGSVAYRFFTDAPPASSKIAGGDEGKPMWLAVQREAKRYGDVVLQPLPGGYGDKEHNAYARRARFQVKWGLREGGGMRFFLRVDDDSFLCLHKLVYELKVVPKEQFFWGRFWCREGRNRADENFMLFSRDVAEVLADDGLVGKLLPFDNEVTLGWNLGYWSWVLNMTVFDDQERLDAQQGYLTKFMHEEKVADRETLSGFCESYLYAHHVHADTMRASFEAARTHRMYELPRQKGPAETCSGDVRTFVPARHSAALPDLQIRRATVGA